MAAQWPRVVNWLLTTLPTLPAFTGVSVFDGAPVTGDNPTAYVTVGYVADDQAGTALTVQDPSGAMWQEVGEVRCQFVANSGDSDLSAVRSQAFALSDAVETVIRADRTLGGTLPPISDVTWTVDVLSVQNENGAAQAFVYTLHYTAVT